MTPSLWFVVPVFRRIELASICLRQLRRTCDLLGRDGVDAHAVLIADAEDFGHLRTSIGADLLGFAHVTRDNDFLSRKFNDGIQLALDERINPSPAGYVVPLGSDDWVDHRILLDLPDDRTVVGFQRMSFVREDGRDMMTAVLGYRGGAGIRIYPRAVMQPFGYRPADEDRRRACDTSILTNLSLHHGDHLRVDHRHHHDAQIVDWKNRDVQLNSYDSIGAQRRTVAGQDPFAKLAAIFPAEALDEMAGYYQRETVAA